MPKSDQSNFVEFHKEMLVTFSFEELRTLCLDLEVNYDTLGGEELGSKIRELIIRMAHNGRLPDLQKAVEDKREHVNWPDIRNSQPPSDWESIGGSIKIPTTVWPKRVAIVVGISVFAIILFFATSIQPTTPAPCKPVSDGEALIIILRFHPIASDSSEVHQLIYDAIEERRQELGLDDVRVEVEPHTILQLSEQEAAQTLGERYDAAVVIWGAETRTSITLNFLNIKEAEVDTGDEKIQVIPPDTLIGAQFNKGYLQGQLAFLSFFAMGQALGAEGKLVEAIPIMEEAVANISEEMIVGELALAKAAARAYFHLGWLYQNSCDLERAIATYTKAIALDSDYVNAYYSRGRAYRASSDSDHLEQAIADYTKAIELDSDKGLAYIGRGYAYYALGGLENLEQAIADYTKAIELNSDYENAYYGRANAYYSSGNSDNLEQAIADYTKAIELDRDEGLAYYGRGNTYLVFGDSENLEKAIADYTKAIELDSNFTNAYIGRGHAYSAFGDSKNLEQAITDYTKAIELDSENVAAYISRGLAYSALGGSENLEQAITDYTKTIELDPDYVDAYIGRGNFYYTFGGAENLEQAIADYTKAIELDREEGRAYYGRGNAYLVFGDPENLEKAIADYTKAIELDSNYANAYIGRGRAYYAFGGAENLRQAIVDYELYLELFSNRSDSNHEVVSNAIKQIKLELEE